MLEELSTLSVRIPQPPSFSFWLIWVRGQGNFEHRKAYISPKIISKRCAKNQFWKQTLLIKQWYIFKQCVDTQDDESNLLIIFHTTKYLCYCKRRVTFSKICRSFCDYTSIQVCTTMMVYYIIIQKFKWLTTWKKLRQWETIIHIWKKQLISKHSDKHKPS